MYPKVSYDATKLIERLFEPLLKSFFGILSVLSTIKSGCNWFRLVTDRMYFISPNIYVLLFLLCHKNLVYAYMWSSPRFTAHIADWDTWQKCYLDDECGAACVEAYHNHYTSTCATLKQEAGYTEHLTCADYGQIHYSGAGSCASPESAATEFIQNMTLMCGCESK